MVRSAPRRRALFADKLLDLANYAVAALVFGQFVSQQGVSWEVILMGVATWLVFATWAFWLTGER